MLFVRYYGCHHKPRVTYYRLRMRISYSFFKSIALILCINKGQLWRLTINHIKWFQIERNHYSHDYLILLAKNILPLQRQTSKPPRSWRCKSLVGHKKKTDGNNKNRNAHDRKIQMDVNRINLHCNWYCNYSLLRRKKVMWISDILVPNVRNQYT